MYVKSKKHGEKFKKITCYFSVQKKKKARKHDWCVTNSFFTRYFIKIFMNKHQGPYETLDYLYPGVKRPIFYIKMAVLFSAYII